VPRNTCPRFIAPQLSQLVKEPLSGCNWAHEIKYPSLSIYHRNRSAEDELGGEITLTSCLIAMDAIVPGPKRLSLLPRGSAATLPLDSGVDVKSRICRNCGGTSHAHTVCRHA
jgi:hypothetical protein